MRNNIKFEARNPKSETNPKSKCSNIPNPLFPESLTRAKNYCYHLLKFRPRSEKELRDRLKKKKFPEEIILETVSYLKKINYLNDREFALAWIKDRINRPLGLKRLSFELKQKGIAEEIIKESLEKIKEDYSESKVVQEIAEEKFKKIITRIDPLKAKQRVYSFLLRRGFSPDIVSETIQNL